MSILKLKIIRTDIISLLSAILYIFIYRYVYTLYLVPIWGYIGYQNYGTDVHQSIAINAVAIIPIFFYSVKKVISNFISILLYCFAYIPIIISFQYYFKDDISMVPYYISLMVAMVFFFLADTVKPISYSNTNYIPLRLYIYIGIILTAIVFGYYGPSNLKLVSFKDVYELRSANAEFRSNAPIIGYFITWSSKLFMPLFISIGMIYNKKKILFIGIGIALIMYSITGQKGTILTPLILFLVNRVLNKYDFRYYFPAIVVFTGFIFLLVNNFRSEYALLLGAVYLMRTVGISSLLACSYVDVFDFGVTPYTYYSHVGVINKITGMYPFNEPAMGRAVWSIYSGKGYDDSMNANANFLITDGIAAGGFIGVIFISIIFFFILKFLNRISHRHNNNFIFLTCLGACMSLLNVSIFTVLVTGGLFILMLFLRYTTILESK